MILSFIKDQIDDKIDNKINELGAEDINSLGSYFDNKISNLEMDDLSFIEDQITDKIDNKFNRLAELIRNI